jgi:hypothetical protein
MCDVCKNPKKKMKVVCEDCENEAKNCKWCNGTGVICNKISKAESLCARCGEVRLLLCAIKMRSTINHTNTERN